MFWLDCIPFGVVIPGICSRGIPAKHGASGHSRLLLLADAQLSIEKIGCFARQRRGALIVCYKIAALSALNTASIGLHDVNHHLYNWGNVGLFFGMGTPEKVAVVEGETTRMKRYLPLGITADERVCSGAHYGRFFADMKHYLDYPELLETPPEKVRFDKGCEYHEAKLSG